MRADDSLTSHLWRQGFSNIGRPKLPHSRVHRLALLGTAPDNFVPSSVTGCATALLIHFTLLLLPLFQRMRLSLI